MLLSPLESSTCTVVVTLCTLPILDMPPIIMAIVTTVEVIGRCRTGERQCNGSESSEFHFHLSFLHQMHPTGMQRQG
ncbi:hypothetical protein WK39_28000 [Burkholderia cepacia]|nr:hypothetical protein WK39_28000 [Burkholderia cepacia]KVS65732.1 hypothetical protein WK40_12310 [Burkholderia cepacia]